MPCAVSRRRTSSGCPAWSPGFTMKPDPLPSGAAQMVKRTSHKQASCPVARPLDVIGDGWSMLIVRDAFEGLTRFGEFQKSLGLAKNILAARLRNLVEHGVMVAVPAESGSHQEYRLTDKGRALFPAGGDSAVGRGLFLRPGRIPYPPGRARQRPAGAAPAGTRRRRQSARRGRYPGQQGLIEGRTGYRRHPFVRRPNGG